MDAAGTGCPVMVVSAQGIRPEVRLSTWRIVWELSSPLCWGKDDRTIKYSYILRYEFLKHNLSSASELKYENVELEEGYKL